MPSDSFNPLPDDKIFDWSKLKAFADNNLNVAKMMISLYDRVENIVGKGENAGYQHFLLFPQCFQKASFPEASKGVIVWEWVKYNSCLSSAGPKGRDLHTKTQKYITMRL